MKSISFILLGLIAWAALVLLTPSKTEGQPQAKPVPVVETTKRFRDLGSRENERAEQKSTAVSNPADATAHREEAQAAIDAAAVTYSPEGVKVIRPLLLDPDPEVRMAARDGMVQLGEADAVPVLRDAASKLTDPAEIASFQEAADLLALPAWSETTEAQDTVAEIVEENAR
jgi:hypothetical protein